MEPQPSGAGGGWDAAAEYDSILDLVRRGRRGADAAGAGAGAEDAAYQSLMAKERRVLDTVDRVVNDAARIERETDSFAKLRLHEVLMRTMTALRGLMDDLLASRSPREALAALAKNDRRIYLGVCLLVLGFLLAVVQAFD